MAHKGLIAWAVLGLWGLLMQATLLFKDDWAARYPQWRPALDLFCKGLGCQIEALQLADAVLIDHASIDLISPEAAADAMPFSMAQWRFQVTLRNAQNITVATPWIEMTLTDLQDQVVMRRVFNPVALGAPMSLSAGEIWSQDLHLQLNNEQVGFTGFRLLSFYP
jgi:hypothetical protein